MTAITIPSINSGNNQLKVLGILSILIWIAKSAESIRRNEPANMLWACNIGALILGVSLIFSFRYPAAVAMLWLSIGLPFWILDLLGGAEFLVTSIFTHLGGLVIGVIGLRMLGMPHGIWWKAIAAGMVLQLISRQLAPPHLNVNISASIWPGWEKYFPSYAVYFVFIWIIGGSVFYAMEQMMHRISVSKEPSEMVAMR